MKKLLLPVCLLLASCTHDPFPRGYHYTCTEYDTSLRYSINTCLNKDTQFATHTYSSWENTEYHMHDSAMKHNGGTSYKTGYAFTANCDSQLNTGGIIDTIVHGKKVVCATE